jgi:hypothetical protein
MLMLVADNHVKAASPTSREALRPDSLTVTVGDVRVRIDGPKLWTLSGIQYKGRVMAVEDSAYGSVFTLRGVGHLGSAHFLDVPGKPGEVEKEIVTDVRFFIDDKPMDSVAPTMNIQGNSFRMERKSKIRGIDLESSVLVRDGVLIETARFRATQPMDLQKAHPMMYAWTPEATTYAFGDESGIQERGAFLREGRAEKIVKNARWMAAFDAASGTGSVCYLLQHPSDADGWFILIDAAGIYRKITALSFVDKIMPQGFDGTYQSAVGFFSARESDWEKQAQRCADELKKLAQKQKQ